MEIFLKQLYKRISWILETQAGINPRRLIRSIWHLPRYTRDLVSFRLKYRGALLLKPCLQDFFAEGGSTKDEYFWQDLIVARAINSSNPKRHIDIGSRIDGFVTHVASFRDIEVMDVRNITTEIPGVIFKQADLMSTQTLSSDMGCYDSVSCLHVLEHLGLGRYSDLIDINGYKVGFENLSKLLAPEGILYLSTPVGKERVEFNANWVFDLQKILELAKINGLAFKSFQSITNGFILSEVFLNVNEIKLTDPEGYQLGLFRFAKSLN